MKKTTIMEKIFAFKFYKDIGFKIKMYNKIYFLIVKNDHPYTESLLRHMKLRSLKELKYKYQVIGEYSRSNFKNDNDLKEMFERMNEGMLVPSLNIDQVFEKIKKLNGNN